MQPLAAKHDRPCLLNSCVNNNKTQTELSCLRTGKKPPPFPWFLSHVHHKSILSLAYSPTDKSPTLRNQYCKTLKNFASLCVHKFCRKCTNCQTINILQNMNSTVKIIQNGIHPRLFVPPTSFPLSQTCENFAQWKMFY